MQASDVFDSISGSEHGANNHHLKHRVVKQRQAKHAPLYVDRNSGYTTSSKPRTLLRLYMLLLTRALLKLYVLLLLEVRRSARYYGSIVLPL